MSERGSDTSGRGKFITLEGIDGAGKSTHVQWVSGWLRERGKDVVTTREPGGTPLGERLRELLLSQSMSVETETLLVFAARREHIAEVIEPALSGGRWVVCDRFTDATYAYQGAGRGLDRARVATLEAWAQCVLRPDLTLLFDVPTELARERLANSASRPDRFEQERGGFFERVRAEYLARAREEPNRVRVLDGSHGRDEVKKRLEDILLSICPDDKL
jgi:dTMP kinase